MIRPISLVIAFLTAASVAHSASADLITFGGKTYESVDWTSASTATDSAVGTISGVNVTFDAVAFQLSTIESGDYSTDAAFDALTFSPTGDLESVRIVGGFGGTNTITFGQQVSSLLVIVGFPGDKDNEPGRQFGPSHWDFDDALSVTLVDTEVSASSAMTELQVDAGNIVNVDPTPSTFSHVSGVFQVEDSSPFSSLSFEQIEFIPRFSDTINITFAAEFSTMTAVIPEPSTLTLWSALAGIGLVAGRLRRRRKPLIS